MEFLATRDAKWIQEDFLSYDYSCPGLVLHALKLMHQSFTSNLEPTRYISA